MLPALVAIAAILGLVVGLLWQRLTELRGQLATLRLDYRGLDSKLDRLQRELQALRRTAAAEERHAPTAVHQPSVATPLQPAPQPSVTAGPAPSSPTAAEGEPPPEPALTPAMATSGDAVDDEPPAVAFPPSPPDAPGLESITAASRWFVEFFTTGNVVAKVGMIVVFFGVAFLLRYAAERGMLAIEYRLMSTAGGAVVLLAVGWRFRESRPEYAVVLQGGAIGVLYLTIFAAFRLYELLPATLTFALLMLVVAFSAVLAIVQGAMALAILGTSGGFLAPILASTGGGSHIGLFSYYAVLNAGVVGIAWFRAWRFLNWLAFVFTFGIGLVWGGQYYQPEFFATTEPFLVVFFLLFLAVAVLFAHRQPPRLRGYIDGSLVFGTPAIAFGLQSVLVRDIPFGRAYSAVVLAALYFALTRVMMGRGDKRGNAMRPLAEAFLALAVVFLVLAVPLAFDGHATAAAWALEGAGLVWMGVRQDRWLARIAGAALLIGAGGTFAAMASPSAADRAVLNTRFLGGVAIAAGSVVAGRLLSRARDSLTPREHALEWLLLAWGLVWWLGVTTVEIGDRVPTRLAPAALLLALAASGCLIALLARRWDWRAMMLATIPIGALSWLFVLPVLLLQGNDGPLTNLGWLAWPAALGSGYLLLFWFEIVWPSLIVKAWHAATAWVLMLLTTWTLASAVTRAVPEAPTWSFATWCVIPVLFVLALQGPARSLAWPTQRFLALYGTVIPFAPVAVSLLWVAVASGQAGAPDPLPYVPLLNPLELTQAFALVVAFAWVRSGTALGAIEEELRLGLRALPAALAFLALNATVGRVVHFHLGVPFALEELARSSVFQTGISILWGVIAGVLMTLARRRLDRPVWMVGAGLLAALIVKLFLVDLGSVGGVARIVSFLATGILILLIGYFAPVPPRSTRSETERAS